MRARTERERRDHTLRHMLLTWKGEWLRSQDKIGGMPESVREALDNELHLNPERWNLHKRGREAVLDFFMAGVWRDSQSVGDAASDPTAASDPEDDPQLSLFTIIGGIRLPSDITYRDPTAGKYKMRTVAIEVATIGQWMKSVELQQEKSRQSLLAIERNAKLGAEMLRRAGGVDSTPISNVADVPKDKAA